MGKFSVGRATLTRVTIDMGNRVKMNLPLDQDEDGYPPFASESLWVEDVGDHQFKIDNIPFYAQELSVGDIVEGVASVGGIFDFVRTVRPSSNSTIRVILYKEDARQALLDNLKNLGCDYEVGVPANLIAVNVPGAVDTSKLLLLLMQEANAANVDYEESSPRYLSHKKS